MRIRQLFSLFIFALLFAGSSAYAQTTSADLIAAAAADGQLDDAELAEISVALANEGSTPEAIATTLNSIPAPDGGNIAVTPAQVATGLSSVGQTPAQVATTLQASGVVAQGDTATAQAAANTGNNNAAAVVTANAANTPAPAVTNPGAAANANLSVSGSGLITDSSGRAVVVKTAADQVNVVAAIVRNTIASGGTVSAEQAANIRSLTTANPELATAANQINDLINAGIAGDSTQVDNTLNEVLDTLEDNGIVVTPPAQS